MFLHVRGQRTRHQEFVDSLRRGHTSLGDFARFSFSLIFPLFVSFFRRFCKKNIPFLFWLKSQQAHTHTPGQMENRQVCFFAVPLWPAIHRELTERSRSTSEKLDGDLLSDLKSCDRLVGLSERARAAIRDCIDSSPDCGERLFCRDSLSKLQNIARSHQVDFTLCLSAALGHRARIQQCASYALAHRKQKSLVSSLMSLSMMDVAPTAQRFVDQLVADTGRAQFLFNKEWMEGYMEAEQREHQCMNVGRHYRGATTLTVVNSVSGYIIAQIVAWPSHFSDPGRHCLMVQGIRASLRYQALRKAGRLPPGSYCQKVAPVVMSAAANWASMNGRRILSVCAPEPVMERLLPGLGFLERIESAELGSFWWAVDVGNLSASAPLLSRCRAGFWGKQLLVAPPLSRHSFLLATTTTAAAASGTTTLLRKWSDLDGVSVVWVELPLLADQCEALRVLVLLENYAKSRRAQKEAHLTVVFLDMQTPARWSELFNAPPTTIENSVCVFWDVLTRSTENLQRFVPTLVADVEIVRFGPGSQATVRPESFLQVWPHKIHSTELSLRHGSPVGDRKRNVVVLNDFQRPVPKRAKR